MLVASASETGENLPLLVMERLTSRERPKSALYAISKVQNYKKGGTLGFVKVQLVVKREKNKGGPLEDFFKKNPKTNLKMRFLNNVTGEKCKRGTRWDVMTSIVLQKILNS